MENKPRREYRSKTCSKCGKVIIPSEEERSKARKQLGPDFDFKKWLCVCTENRRKEKEDVSS